MSTYNKREWSMRNRSKSLIASLLLTCLGIFFSGDMAGYPLSSYAQSPVPIPAPKLQVKGDLDKVQVDRLIVVKDDLLVAKSFKDLRIEAPTGAGLYFWSFSSGVQATDKGDVLEIVSAPKGIIVVSVKIISAKLDKDGKFLGFSTTFDSTSFSIGVPEPPKPPEPPVPPVPPTPPSPIPLAGLRVVIMFDKTTLTDAQDAVVYGREVRDYLESKCVLDTESNAKAYWIIPTGSDISGVPSWVRDVVQRHPGKFSWMVVSNGDTKTGYDDAIPADKVKALELLRKHGG